MNNKTIKRLVRNMLFFIILIFLTFFFIFKDQDINELFNIVCSSNKVYIILGILIMLIYFIIQSINVRSILNSLGEKISILKMLKFTLIEYFFNAITPAASGGQPMEIYYMSKDGYNGSKVTLALLIEVCSFQIATIFFGILCMLINPKVITSNIRLLFILGITFNTIILSIMLICIFSKRLTKLLIRIYIKIIEFLRVKDLEFKKKEVILALRKYNESSLYIKEHKHEFYKSIFRVMLQIICFHSVTYFVYKSFGLNEYSFIELFTRQAILYSTVSCIPLPGSVGISETVFLTIFNPIFGNELLSSAVVLSRGITFYLYVLICSIIVIVNIIGKKK